MEVLRKIGQMNTFNQNHQIYLREIGHITRNEQVTESDIVYIFGENRTKGKSD